MIDYLLKFPSKAVAEQFGVANGFAQANEEGVIVSSLASYQHALYEIGEHNGDGNYWVLFRDLVGIPIPEGGNQFIVWSSTMTITDDAGSEISLPRPEFNPDIPNAFWV
jgi:hypothetical protein